MADNSEVVVSGNPEIGQPTDVDEAEKAKSSLEDPYKKAVNYLEEHHIVQIFQTITSGMVYDQPENPLDYMIEQVEKMEKEGKFLGPKKD